MAQLFSLGIAATILVLLIFIMPFKIIEREVGFVAKPVTESAGKHAVAWAWMRRGAVAVFRLFFHEGLIGRVVSRVLSFRFSHTFYSDVCLSLMPNKTPEPTAVGAVSSAVAVYIASRRWLSFFR